VPTVPRVGLFTRLNIVVGIAIYSFLPLLFHLSDLRTGRMDLSDWGSLLVEIVLLQGLLWLAARRCSSAQLAFWQGVTLTAACMRTGFVYFDLVLSGVSVAVLLLASACFSILPNPTSLYVGAVRLFYENRMYQ
jgi:hypothetical protein